MVAAYAVIYTLTHAFRYMLDLQEKKHEIITTPYTMRIFFINANTNLKK